MRAFRNVVAVGAVIGVLVSFGCGNDDEGGGPPPAQEHTGTPCSAPNQCYPWMDGGALLGDRICLAEVPGGYCTHACTTDSDCCAVQGECRTAHPQVCAPFQSTGAKMCFLSCEKTDVESAGVLGPNEAWEADRYCSTYAWSGFGCRSSGGGSENRKVCVP